ncbi:MAG: Gfo/Idh/MocA family oxidoreductase, partial [Verrucomicrobia bacterium]|nr:Gfo/Idh/MocA family oxidoreductase [Cytophagales bacterium]
VSQKMVDLAVQTAAHQAFNRNDNNLTVNTLQFTNGHGFDSVIITAAVPTNDPIELAAEISRKKGKVIVVGAVKMDIPRDPHFYRKELELRMSCSYGPGRYDVNYEENGQDYPFAYVRWTEQRNMEAFLKLISNQAVSLKPLVTHIFEVEQAEQAYDLVLGKTSEPFIGILLKYPDNEQKFKSLVQISGISSAEKNIVVGFIGAGSFAQSYLIPNLKNEVSLETVVTSKGITAKNVGEKFGFKNASASAADVLENQHINTVFIATQHNTHADFLIKALQAGKHVFVEKPLAMHEEELTAIVEIYQNHAECKLMVGFNRRFAPLSVQAKALFKSVNEPLVMNFRVNAGFIAKDHWTQQAHLGGGRIVGEICHFIDLMQFFTQAKPVKVFAECIDSQQEKLKNDDNLAVIVKFSDGSVGNLTYLANGDKSMPKEKIEIFGGNQVFVIDDFKTGTHFFNNTQKVYKTAGKGHAQEVKAFLESIRNNTPSPIDFESLVNTTLTTFKIQDSLATGLPQLIDN